MIFLEKNEHISPDISLEPAAQAASVALRHMAAPKDANLTIVLTDDHQLRELNHEYLGFDTPTDVLSFPSDQVDPETGSPYLGDIVISVERAAAQAAGAGHPVEAEMQLLVVHGILHLLGHDHAEADEKAQMWKKQAEILELLGLGNIEIRES